MEKMKMESPDLVAQNIEKIAELFPNCITEMRGSDGKLKKAINFDALRQTLSSDVLDGPEAYEFTWVGKKAAEVEAYKPIRKTLRPCVEDSLDWDTTENLYIEGENLEVLKLLQESYLGKIKMIYIDPPYNTGNDFIYRDNFSMSSEEYSEESGQIDEEGNRLFKNTDTNGRFHSDWCSMIYSRLLLARNLLSDDGVIFISIDDNEQGNLKKICDDIFGVQNYCGVFIINSAPNARDYGHIAKMHEFCLLYAKDVLLARTNMLEEENKKFKYTDKISGFNIHPLYNSNEAFHKLNRPNLYYPFYLYPDEILDDKNGFYKIGLEKKNNSIEIYPPKSLKNGVQFVWRWNKEKALRYMNEEIIGYKVNKGEYRIVQKMRHDKKIIRSLLLDKKYSSRRGTAEVEELMGGKAFSFPKPMGLLMDFCKVGLTEQSVILDFFSGSATTAHAVMQLNAKDGGTRKFIMVQAPEPCAENSIAYRAGYKNICEIGKERIRRAGKKIKEENPEAADLDTGFRVFKLDEGNMKDVYYSADEYNQEMLSDMESNIKPDRNELDLLFGCLIDLGIPLSNPYSSEEIDGVNVHTYNYAEGKLIACFDENIPDSVIEKIAKKKPKLAVFRDSSFADNPAKINAGEKFKMFSIDTSLKIL